MFSPHTTVAVRRSILWNENPLVSCLETRDTQVIVQVICIFFPTGKERSALGSRTFSFGAFGTLSDQDRPMLEGCIGKKMKHALANLLRKDELPYWAYPFRNGRVVVNSYATQCKTLQEKSDILLVIRDEFPRIFDSSFGGIYFDGDEELQDFQPPASSSSSSSQTSQDSAGSQESSTTVLLDPRRRPVGTSNVPPAERNPAKPSRITPPSQKPPFVEVPGAPVRCVTPPQKRPLLECPGAPVANRFKKRILRQPIPFLRVKEEPGEPVAAVESHGRVGRMIIHPDRRYYFGFIKSEPRARSSRWE